MKIENNILKIYNKVKEFCRNNFGKTKGAEIILKALISLLYACDHYYYLEDFKIPGILALILDGAIIYLAISIFIFFAKYIMVVILRIKPINLTTYILLFFALDFFVGESLDLDLPTWQYNLLLMGILIYTIIFSKSTISLFKNKKKLALLLFLPSLSLGLGIFYFFLFPGFERQNLNLPKFNKDNIVERLSIGEAISFSYDGPEVPLNKYVKYGGITKKVRDFYFKKKLNQVPLKGQVYLPKGRKNSPVLFVVHGNHRMTEKNYLGYEYLGNYLAERGIAVISIGMNMLNGFMKYSVKNENDARAILLLENIKYILKENRNEKSKLYKTIDPTNIALLGHSRGGEAIAIANNFNKLNRNPDNGNEKFDYGFNIKGLIGVAPTYGQYEPSDKKLKLWDVNYLTLAGTNDCDVTTFEGQMQYDSLKFPENSDKFKASVYIGYANHGNFNSLWGEFDTEAPEGLNINRKELLDGINQRRILCIYVYNFLENIFDKSFNRDLFKYGPYKYKDFPETTYYSRYMDGSYENICNFEEDTNIQSASTYGDYISYENFSDIYEAAHSYGEDKGEDNAVFLSTNDKSKYAIFLKHLPKVRKFLAFDLENFEEINNNNMDFTIRIQDTMGENSYVNFKDYFVAYPPTKVYLWKTNYLFDDYYNYSAPISQRIKLEDFKINNPLINLDKINKIEFDFDKSLGDISLDNIGFAN